jgi:exosortase F-associated protein
MPRVVRYGLVAVLFLVLVAVRAFEDVLFYDPYLSFFRKDYLYMDSPRREVAKLVAFTSLRYLINTIASLGIIYLLLKDKGILKLAVLLYSGAFILLIIPFLYFVINPKQEDYYLFFNVRRFLIQPLFLILFLPAFYYFKLNR